ncbi:histone acetyltransferase MYST2 [Dothidotthia symphoricarpi CBS 119687]|uniref:histone acetyltransferase n=1 Tax=Dothidotthia symphoricarpi CBS 119687 TaxID=1392245 RepID=A0A6A6AUC4_9PLEO|nr:histone acetyltransferase MYST2 [Dothidotthia symphoricarpi CBS 119687]KAF2134565.1 histone acetyltransferase MYST2 [Dothidotthia symphoricarpi CBS 119687]
MASTSTFTTEGHKSVYWPIQSFAVGNDFKSQPEILTHLLLDRANCEFGLLYPLDSGVAIMAQFPDNDEPIYFQVSGVCAASFRCNNTCKKVCILMQNFQIDLEFTLAEHAQDFLQTLEQLATKLGNLYFQVYEVPNNVAFTKAEFSMQKMGYISSVPQSWVVVLDSDTSEWARIYKTNKCSDFTVFAGNKSFPVHRILLCTRSQYFDAVCDGCFTESESRSIVLPESEQTVGTMLEEMYDVYNPTTGSLFTGFALLREIEKERIMRDLLSLFVACDKYNLEKIKQKTAETIIDRLPFVGDALNIIDIAAFVFNDQFPQMDRGLRKAVIIQTLARLPAITNDEDAWEEYMRHGVVVRAVSTQYYETKEPVIMTPPSTPEKHANTPLHFPCTSMALDVASSNDTPLKAASKPLQKLPAEPNVLEVVFGSLLIKPWYPSFYPEELVGRKVERLYVCQWCFKYSKELMAFLGHLKTCPLRCTPPPGVRIYTKDNYSLYEIDGEKHKLYAQNLSLFAKLFLDTKSVFYDVTTFLYYLLVAHNPTPNIPNTNLGGDGTALQHQVVGFFSKEKMSWDNNNLACILVFPPWQKQGLGQILMGASYEMSKKEGRLGGPEKPLSDLGLRAYTHYWSQTLARTILGCTSKKIITVVDLREKTYITPDDMIATLQAMDVLEQKKRGGAEVVINKARVRAWVERNKIDLWNPVDSGAFIVRERSRSQSEE